MWYLKIKKILGKHIISLPESVDIKIDGLIINNKHFSIEPDIIYNQYVIKEKVVPKAKKIIFLSKEKSYSGDYILRRGNIVFKNGKAGFGVVSSANGIVKKYFLNELYPDIDKLIKNKYLITMRNYSWLFIKFAYERKLIKKETDLNLFVSSFPDFFMSTSYGIINKHFVEYADIAKIYSILENEKPDDAKSILKKYNNHNEDFLNIKKEISDFVKGKPKEVVSFISKVTLGI